MTLTKDQENFIQDQQAKIDNLMTKETSNQTREIQQSMMVQQQERSMVKDQIDLTQELETIEHLLKGEVLKRDKETGNIDWEEPEDKDMIILSPYGIHLIMNSIQFYINKNTLMSNYDEETINQKMEDFTEDLADTIFMEYEKVFQYPSFEDCRKVLESRIERRKELRKFTNEIIGKEIITDEEITKQLYGEIEGKIDREIEKIKEQIIKNKLKRFLILMRTVQDAVHSTYLRAYQGQERRSLRQHMHITEAIGNSSVPKNTSQFNPFSSWGGKK